MSGEQMRECEVDLAAENFVDASALASRFTRKSVRSRLGRIWRRARRARRQLCEHRTASVADRRSFRGFMLPVRTGLKSEGKRAAGIAPITHLLRLAQNTGNSRE